ncbi:LuxR C-terminal-related transcriptional regulator [Promicromonospora iranensis]|uniref:DNA-binding CsgD family transcriptional regulator n=1 Tax=Promicromonospora iranensis TaxID=1105144 RepID=A0ABU2CUJ3_9MICO|nr:LuxR C-terminal-related transcriptional regulator [Promicromonospora iranensis]MDR7384989.1 DNA-binding CsgD family transcriptional regulator [Promicromonospora iranensis]
MNPEPIPVARRGTTLAPRAPRLAVAPDPADSTHPLAAADLAPRLPRVYVPRPRLWQRLDEAAEGSVTLVVAPAGAGKTLGVAGWLRCTASARATGAVWVRADDTWTPEQLGSVLDARVPATVPDRPPTTVSSTVSSTLSPTLVVIDDAHLLPAATLRHIDDRLNAAPDSMRVLLLSRWALPLTRLVPELLGNFTFLRGDLLRLSDAECASLVADHAGTDDPDVVAAITRHADGWCAAAVLAARGLRGTPYPAAAARLLAADAEPIANRVAGEVFSTLTPRQRHLLLCIAGEDAVSVPTAAHLSHDVHAGEILTELEDTGLLVLRTGDAYHLEARTAELPVVPADDRSPDPPASSAAPASPDAPGPDGFRVHPLLVEVVRQRLAAGGVDAARARATVIRAVGLDVARGNLSRSFARLVRVGAPVEAADILARDGVRMVLNQCGPDAVAEFVRAEPEVVESRPDVWFAIALGCWLRDDVEGARHWGDRILDARRRWSHAWLPGGMDGLDGTVACVRLWRVALGLEPAYAAVGHAKRVLVASQTRPAVREANAEVLPVLAHELGAAQNWLGELTDAEASLTLAVSLSRSQGLAPLGTCALSHLAFTQFMRGRESACVELAGEVLVAARAPGATNVRFVAARANLARLLARLLDVPAPTELTVDPFPGVRYHSGDLCTRFWFRVWDSRQEMLAGNVVEAQRILSGPGECLRLTDEQLPEHLRVALLVERAFVATLASDRDTLKSLHDTLDRLGAVGESALVQGLRADRDGDRRGAVAAFEAASADATYSQPPTRALALACEAQLLDALGDPARSHERLIEAIAVTESRRNAAPFFGWARQGTPIETLLQRLTKRPATRWLHELAATRAGQPDVTAVYASMTATPSELDEVSQALAPPALSPREREVLNELARGATYADIAAALFVSENTVKTHVSSLYTKLAASRRSEALKIARSFHLL